MYIASKKYNKLTGMLSTSYESKCKQTNILDNHRNIACNISTHINTKTADKRHYYNKMY